MSNVWITNGTAAPPSSWQTLTTTTTPNTISSGAFGRTGIPSPPIADATDSKFLSSEVFELPVERLIDLWLAKYGNEWIDLVEFQDDSFYSLVYMRLKSIGELEVHYLTDRARYVCRKPK